MMGQGDVVTAWTLALYIVTTAAGEFPNSKMTCSLLIERSTYCIDGDYRESEGYLGILEIPLCEHLSILLHSFWGGVIWSIAYSEKGLASALSQG
jgi:hypothetical protein